MSWRKTAFMLGAVVLCTSLLVAAVQPPVQTARDNAAVESTDVAVPAPVKAEGKLAQLDPAAPPTLPAPELGCGTGAVVLPFTENFDSGSPGAFANAGGDDFDWSWNSGSTGSSNTGPSGDHTSGSGYYVYTESSSPNYPSLTAILMGPNFDFSGATAPGIQFWYHMYGDAMGTLYLEASDDACATWTEVWSLSGNQGDQWFEAFVDLSAYAGASDVVLRFRGVTGSSFTSDMAVDDVAVADFASITGACCDGATCSELTESDCLAIPGAVFYGPFTTCVANTCEAACCETFTVACIGDLTEADCLALPDTNWNQYETCANFTCPTPYCTPCWTNTTDDWITNVTFGTINNTTGQDGPCSYGDYTNLQTQVVPGGTYNLSVTFYSEGTWTECVTAWFDWDRSGTFDGDEWYDLGCGVDATLTLDITVPGDAATGVSFFRVTEKYSSAATDPCAGGSFGETEDYSMLIGEVEGACCFSDGTCQYLLPTDCANLGGSYGGSFTQCANDDCNANQVDDFCDVLAGTSLDCNANFIPDECELVGNDCNGNGIPDECDIASGFSPDCNENGVPDECDVDPNDPDGNGMVSIDCDQNGIPDECEEDCNGNGIVDSCDVDPTDPDGNGMVSEDCQGDGIPDECQIGALDGGDPKFHVSSRRDTGHKVYLFDDAGNFLSEYDQVVTPAQSTWGYRDGAFDGSNVYFGCEPGLYVHDQDGANGAQMFANPIADTIRALAYDPTSDSFWTANFSSDLYNIAMDGSVITQFPDAGWSLYGLAWNDDNGTLLGHDTGGAIIEIDPANGSILGTVCAGTGTTQGGLSGYGELGGMLAAVWQETPDKLVIVDPSDCSTPNVWDVETPTGSNQILGVAVLGIGGADCNGNGIPDECDIPISLGGFCDPAVSTCSDDCNGDMVPDECQLGPNDCNGNGIPDDCDIANGTSMDCQPDGVPDECQVPPLCPNCPDCNFDGIPDECQLDGNDCNGNGIPDDCDIANGTSEDCQGDGIPDECQLYTTDNSRVTYLWDDGSSENALGLTNGGEICWIQHYVVTGPDGQCIESVSTVWGNVGSVNPAGVDPGEAVRVFVWSDPNGDGDPADAVFLAEGNDFADPASIQTDVFQTIDIFPAVDVGGPAASFFVGASAVHNAQEFPAPMDENGVQQDEAWLGYVVGGTYDPTVIGGQEPTPLNMTAIGFPANWLIRAEGVSCGAPPNDCNENGIPDECDIAIQFGGFCDPNAGPCSSDYNNNGVPDECELCGDFDGDGDVDMDDFWLFVDALGACQGDPKYRADADFDADGCITLVDWQTWIMCYRMANGTAPPGLPNLKNTIAPAPATRR